MARWTVLRSVVMVAVVAALLGGVSLYAELQSKAAVTKAGRWQADPPTACPGMAPSVLEVELLPDRTQLLLFPQIPDVVRRSGKRLLWTSGCYQCEDGRLYHGAGGQRHRIWLFAVVSDHKPEVTVHN
jgi:hypothetical protein